MNNSNYEMTTVCNYVALLDEGLKEKEQVIKSAVEKHLLQMRKINSNANMFKRLYKLASTEL